jgi:hypothetical protein
MLRVGFTFWSRYIKTVVAATTPILCLVLGWANPVLALSPRVSILQWTDEINPVWGPRLANGFRVLVDADTGFGGSPENKTLTSKQNRTLIPEDLFDGGSKKVAIELAVPFLVHLELADPAAEVQPEHRVFREKWKPWESAETWGLPLRLTVWDGEKGRVIYRGIVPGEKTKKANQYWPYRSFNSFGFLEKENLRDKLLNTALEAARDTLARVVLGRKNSINQTP